MTQHSKHATGHDQEMSGVWNTVAAVGSTVDAAIVHNADDQFVEIIVLVTKQSSTRLKVQPLYVGHVGRRYCENIITAQTCDCVDSRLKSQMGL